MELTESTPCMQYDDPEGGDIIVVRLCPKCGKFLKSGRVYTNLLGQVKLAGWICKTCGEVDPDWDRV